MLVWLPLLLFCCSLAALGLSPDPAARSGRGDLSFALLQLSVFVGFAVAHRLARGRALRAVLGGAASLYAAYLVFDAFLLSKTSHSLPESLALLVDRGDFVRTLLDEAAITPSQLGLLALGAVLALVAGGSLQALESRRSRWPWRSRATAAATAVAVLASGLFVTEQYVSRSRWEYLTREFVYPVYPRLFRPQRYSEVLRSRLPDRLVEREHSLSAVGTPGNPRDVVMFLLESWRADLLDPEITPHLWRLRAESLRYNAAYTEGIYTMLAWTVFLLDLPAIAWGISDDGSLRESARVGSWPLSVLHRAGYRTHLGFSHELRWKGFDGRVLGGGDSVDRYFNADDFAAATDRDHRLTVRDRHVVRTARSWIADLPDDRPSFLLLQLGSTHWTYSFEPEDAVAAPWAETGDLAELQSPEGLERLRARYLNAAHFVDARIGEVLDALRAAGRYDDAAIVVVADHGEGFAPGRTGHGALHAGTKRIPLLMRLPELAPRDVDRLVSLRDVHATLFDYLEIEGIEATRQLGRSALPSRPARRGLLSMQVKRADLVLPEATVRLRVEPLLAGRARWTVTEVLDPDEQRVADPDTLLTRLPWRAVLREWVEGS